jgi:membrane-bound inhibitor of C-type lysozyme
MKSRPMRRAAAALACGLALAASGCVVSDARLAAPMPMPWGATVGVVCLNGQTMSIDFLPSRDAARVTFDGTTMTLPKVDTAADAQFSNGEYTLYINDQRTVLTQTGVVLRGPCRPA